MLAATCADILARNRAAPEGRDMDQVSGMKWELRMPAVMSPPATTSRSWCWRSRPDQEAAIRAHGVGPASPGSRLSNRTVPSATRTSTSPLGLSARNSVVPAPRRGYRCPGADTRARRCPTSAGRSSNGRRATVIEHERHRTLHGLAGRPGGSGDLLCCTRGGRSPTGRGTMARDGEVPGRARSRRQPYLGGDISTGSVGIGADPLRLGQNDLSLFARQSRHRDGQSHGQPE